MLAQVRRQQLLNDTVLQMRRAHKSLKRPLKVKFIGEEGVDEVSLWSSSISKCQNVNSGLLMHAVVMLHSLLAVCLSDAGLLTVQSCVSLQGGVTKASDTAVSGYAARWSHYCCSALLAVPSIIRAAEHPPMAHVCTCVFCGNVVCMQRQWRLGRIVLSCGRRSFSSS